MHHYFHTPAVFLGRAGLCLLTGRPIRSRPGVTLHRGGASRQKYRLPIGPWRLDSRVTSQSAASLDLTTVWPRAAFLMVAWWGASPRLERSRFSGWTSAPEWTSWSLSDIQRRFLTSSGLKWEDAELSCRSWIMWVKEVEQKVQFGGFYITWSRLPSRVQHHAKTHLRGSGWRWTSTWLDLIKWDLFFHVRRLAQTNGDDHWRGFHLHNELGGFTAAVRLFPG